MTRMIDGSRSLAIDPTSRGFGYIVLEGSEHLVDWGLAHLATPEVSVYCRRVEKLLDRFSPGVLILEETRGSKRGSRARGRNELAAKLARKRGIKVQKISRAQVKRLFKASGSTKWEIAVAISRWFPELAPSLPKKKRIWESEDPHIATFNAASFALTLLREQEWSGQDSRGNAAVG